MAEYVWSCIKLYQSYPSFENWQMRSIITRPKYCYHTTFVKCRARWIEFKCYNASYKSWNSFSYIARVAQRCTRVRTEIALRFDMALRSKPKLPVAKDIMTTYCNRSKRFKIAVILFLFSIIYSKTYVLRWSIISLPCRSLMYKENVS